MTFMKPRLCGPRFEGGAIPLEVLSDLSALGEMIIEVAKWRFLENNPERQRSPRGFVDVVGFKLAAVERGSAIAVIELEDTKGGQLPSMPVQYQAYFDEAREHIIDAIAAAGRNGEPAKLPEKFLGYFDRIGRSLHADEAIELVHSSQSRPVRLTPEVRRKLLLGSPDTQEFSEEVVIRGSVSELDQDNMTFTLQCIGGRKITGTFMNQHLDILMQAFNEYKDQARVSIQGIGRYDRQERLIGISSLEHVTVLDPLDVAARLEEFRVLEDGWFEDTGKAPDLRGLDWLAGQFNRNFPDDLPLPYTFPTPKGGVEMEWSFDRQSLHLEIDIVGHRGNWLRYDKYADDNEEERDLDLNDESDWSWFAGEIRRLVPTQRNER